MRGPLDAFNYLRRKILWKKQKVVLEKNEDQGQTAGNLKILILKNLNAEVNKIGDLERTEEYLNKIEFNKFE